ncbi:AraC family transcriptional regulator [Microbacteriaceae bacterium K1510]|nr:AraC family transcriptional regulator [Microbacteriaceae bacterium K1510]
MTGGELLSAYPLVRTDKVDELRRALARLVSNPMVEQIGRDRPLGAVQNHHHLKDIGISYGRYGAAIRFENPVPKIISQIYPVRQSAEVTVDGATVVVGGDCGAAVSAQASEYKILAAAGYERLMMLVDEHAACAKLSALLGTPVSGPLMLEPRHDLNALLARSLRQNFMFLVAQVEAGLALPPLVLAEFEQTLMVMFLLANRHNYSHLLEKHCRDGGERQVRAAEAHIEAHWDKPLRIEGLVAASGLSARSLFQTSRKRRGYSPLDYLKQTRLREARARLLKHEATVQSVAWVCGFRDVAQFAADYCETFGEDPAATIRSRQRSH